MKLHCGSDSASRCCARRASARVAYVPFSSSPAYTLYGARGSSSSLAMLRLAGYYLVLERDALEFLAEVLDPIFRRLVLNRRHEPGNRIRAACRAKHAVFWAVVDDGPDFEFVGHFTGLANSLGQSVRVHYHDQADPKKNSGRRGVAHCVASVRVRCSRRQPALPTHPLDRATLVPSPTS